MGRRICYVLGGPLQAAVEAAKRQGQQPLAEFNTFVERNEAELISTADVPAALRRIGRGAVNRCALAVRLRGRRDILLASGEDVGLPLALATLGLRAPPPVWMVLHGTHLGGRKFAAAAALLRGAGHVHFLCLSESLRRQLVASYGLPAERCHNAGYGVDTAFFSPEPPAAATGPLVLSAGRSHRDYPTLMEAVRGLGVPLRIAADSLWRPSGTPVHTGTLPPATEIRSAGSYGGLRALYAQASVVVVPLHPARHACGYAVIAEAMAMGRAVVTTRTAAPSDFVVEGETGLYVEPGDVDGLRGAILRLLDRPDLARRMGEAGAARMRDSFSLDAYCGRIEGLVAAAA